MSPTSDRNGTIIPDGVPYTQIAHEAITDPNLDAYAFRVYAYLMRRANTTSRAWPSQRTIATDCHLARNTVAKAIDTLRSEGWITVAKEPTATKHQQRHVYTVRGSKPARLPLEDNQPTTPTGSPHEPAHDVTPTGSSREHEPAHDVGRKNNHELQPENYNHSEAETAIATTTNGHDELVWALVDAMGWNRDEITQASWGRLHKAAKDLEYVGAEPDDVARRAQVYRVNFRSATMTPNAIAANWADLAEPRQPVTHADVEKAARKADMAQWVADTEAEEAASEAMAP
jgi:hypothetical protein